MTWMLIRLVLSLAFVGLVLWFAARVAKKRGLGGGGAHGLIEVVARQRMGRSSSVNVVRIGDVVLVVGATEEQITLLAEVDTETIDAALHQGEASRPARMPARTPRPAPAPRYASDEYDRRGYDEQVPHDRPYDGEGYSAHEDDRYADHADDHAAEQYADDYAERRRDPRRSGGQHADRPRHSPAARHPAVAPEAASGPLAGSVFDKNGWGSFVNELRERTVRRP